jgi:hypothetical protein
MATHVLAREDLFPAGTTVGVYFGPLLSGSRTGAPPGGAVTSAVVQSNGTATFTNLLDSRSYVVYASVGGQDRYAQFRTPDIAVQTAVAPGGIQASVVDAKGDLLVGTASDTVGRLGVGANGQALTADSTTGTGLAWAAVAGGAASVPFILADAPDRGGGDGYRDAGRQDRSGDQREQAAGVADGDVSAFECVGHRCGEVRDAGRRR